MFFQIPWIYRVSTHIKFANNTKANHIMVSLLIRSAKDRWKYTKSCFKENARKCPKKSTTQGNIRIPRLKKRLRNLYQTYPKLIRNLYGKKRKHPNQKLNHLSEIYKINFTIAKQTSKRRKTWCFHQMEA